MAARDDLVIDLMEEEEEEWPEAGVQNPEEAEWYTEKINNAFNFDSSGHEDGFGTNNSKFQKDCSKAVGEHGGCWCRRHPQVH